ncbi:hypothetical protein U1Q18_007831 [Sarracenia purpurea var. burkii]
MKFFNILGEKSQAAATGGTSPTISVQRARKIEVQLRRSSELQAISVTVLKKEAQEEEAFILCGACVVL